MHFLNTLAVSFLTLTAVSAAPLQKRDIVGDPTNPIDDLLTNVEGGLEGFGTFLTGESSKFKRDVTDSLDGTLEGIVGFFEGGQGEGLKARDDVVTTTGETVKSVGGFLDGSQGEGLKTRQTTNPDNLVDTAVNGVEGATAELNEGALKPLIGYSE